MHGTVEHHGRGHDFKAERANEVRRLPVSMRHRGFETLAPWRPAVTPKPSRSTAPSLVNEHQPPRLPIGLGAEPGLPAAQVVSKLLLAGERGTSCRAGRAAARPCHLGHRRHAPRPACAAISPRRENRRLVNQRQDFLSMGIDPVRAVVTALRPRTDDLPVRRHRFTHLIAVEAATPQRRVAERRDRPLSTDDTSRSRRPIAKDARRCRLASATSHILNQKFDPMGPKKNP